MKRTFCKLLTLALSVLLLLPSMVFAEPERDEAVTATTADIWDGSIADGFAGGTGTEDDPFLITNGAELAYFGYTVNVERNRYTGQYLKLANDIYLNDTTNWQEWGSMDASGSVIAPANEWTAIGINDNSDYPNSWPSLFNATFDGDGHFVSGIYINNELDNQGLFGYAPCCTIKNLGVIDSYISGRNEVGAIAGKMLAYPLPSYILNCYNYGTIHGEVEVGGIVGAHNNVVDSCFNMGAVTGGTDVAGIVGTGKNITNCFNAGDIRLSGTDSGTPDMGGIVGYLWGTAENCYNVGTIYAENRWNGGIVGFNDGTISNCYYLDTCGGLNEEGTSLTDAQMQDAASFIGFDFDTVWTMSGDADYLYPELINTPLWAEPVSNIWDGSIADGFAGGTGTEDDPFLITNGAELAYFGYTVNVERNRYTGQYLKLANDIYLNDTTNWQEWGSMDASGSVIAPANEWTAIGINDNSDYPNSWPSLFNATFDGDGHFVSGIYINNELDNQGLFGYAPCCTIKNLGVIDSYISGRNEVGAIAGKMLAYPLPSYILNCYNYGTIHGEVEVGGIVGAHNNVVDSCFNMGAVTGGTDVAGIVGTGKNITNCFNAGDIRLSGTDSGTPDMGGIVGYLWGTAENCYNVGTIYAENRWNGGIVGFNDGTISNCYYLDTCGGLNEEGTSLTDAQMQDAASFIGFNFDTVWTMAGDADYLYPELINTPLWTEPATDIRMGDVNFSGEVLADDALLVLRYSLGLCSLNANQLEVADMNGDSFVNAIDALLILGVALS